ncbi:hypothetical protein Ddye_019835 [Dipteronia dyeriana]|uniref:Carbohydrate kinase FGGY N-terminal domain-containing protein n=1 Tax=Dipteronia dyeriana TaxID=168575 RepID=A0AAD9WWH6_9ROSI|nr:hypothetical protein Ddye_019835 [Dipteronia dyeriana]
MSKEDVFIGSLNEGTISTTFIIYDRHARPVGSHQVEFTQFYPEAGWVEHDPMEILESVKVCMAKALDKATANGHNVDSGFKGIGSTTLLWSKSIGSPLYNAIVWMDARTSSVCWKLEKELSGHFSAMKLIWLMENVDTVKQAIKSGDAPFGTIDTRLIWNLTGGVKGGLHVTDLSKLMHLETLDWDQPSLKSLGIPAEILPKIAGIPISGYAAVLGIVVKSTPSRSPRR